MDWFVMIDGEERGPMPEDGVARHFAAGEIDGESYVWRDGFDEWLPAFLVEELAGVFEKKPPSLRRPPPPPEAAKSKRVPVRVDITNPDGVASPSPWENPTNVEPLPLGERVHQEKLASALFTDPGAKVKVGTTGSFALDLASWDAAALKAKAAAAAAANANASANAGAPPPPAALQLARPAAQPLPKPISSAGAVKPPMSALRPPPPEPPKRGMKLALLLGGALFVVLAIVLYAAAR